MIVVNDFTVVREVEMNDKSNSSGLVIPTTSNELDSKVKYGEVVSIGNKIIDELEIGKIVVFNKYYSMPFEYKGKKFISVPTKDIIAILDDETEVNE